MLKKLAEEMLKKSKVSKEDVSILKAMFDEASAEEQAEATPAVGEVEAKAQQAEAEAAPAKAEEQSKEEPKPAEKAEEPKAEELKAAEVAKFAEMTERAEKAEKQLAEVKAKEDARVLSERVGAFTLSATKDKGFNKVSEPTLKEFIGSLSEEQYSKFSELMKGYVAVNTKEIGSAVAGEFSGDEKVNVAGTTYAVKGADDDLAIKALMSEKKLSYFDAAQVYASTKK